MITDVPTPGPPPITPPLAVVVAVATPGEPELQVPPGVLLLNVIFEPVHTALRPVIAGGIGVTETVIVADTPHPLS